VGSCADPCSCWASLGEWNGTKSDGFVNIAEELEMGFGAILACRAGKPSAWVWGRVTGWRCEQGLFGQWACGSWASSPDE
jgi:hypothetical protein